MRPPMMEAHLGTFGMGVEIFSLIIIFLSSMLIYYKTSKIYSLTEHRGIKYFRKGFLFFGFSFFIRIFAFFLEPGFMDSIVDRKWAFIVSAIFAMIALCYLIASMHYKKIKEYYIYLVNLLVVFLLIFFTEPILIGVYGLILAFTFGITSIIKYKKSKKRMFSQIYFMYVLMFLFWIFLAFSQSVTQILKIGRFYGVLVTATFFMYLAYLVIHKLNPNHVK